MAVGAPVDRVMVHVLVSVGMLMKSTWSRDGHYGTPANADALAQLGSMFWFVYPPVQNSV